MGQIADEKEQELQDMKDGGEYAIFTLRPRPSMSEDREMFFAPTYADAVKLCRERFAQSGRTTKLCSASNGVPGIYWWHRITTEGEQDRNTNAIF